MKVVKQNFFQNIIFLVYNTNEISIIFFWKKFKMAILWVSAILAVFGFAHHHFAQFFGKVCAKILHFYFCILILTPELGWTLHIHSNVKNVKNSVKSSKFQTACDAPIWKILQFVYNKKFLVLCIFLKF